MDGLGSLDSSARGGVVAEGTEGSVFGRWGVRLALCVLVGLAGMAALASPVMAGWVLPSAEISPGNAVVYNPKVGIGPGGTTTVVWQLDNNFDDIIQATTRPGGTGSFGSPVTVFQNANINNVVPEIAIGPKGATEVVWTAQSGSYSNASYSGRPGSSGSFSPPAAMELGLNDELPYPDLAAGPGGRLAIVWMGSAQANSRIQARIRTSAGGSFSSVDYLSELGGDALYPKVAMASDGDATAVWQRWNGSGYTVQAATRPAEASEFSAPEDLSAIGENARNPQIGIARNGTTTVVWQRQNSGQGDLRAARRAAGADGFGSPVEIPTPGSALEPDLAVGPDGTITVAWVELVGSDWIVRTATRPKGTGAFGNRTIATAISGAAPQVATGVDGTTVVTWRSPNTAGNGVNAATRQPNATAFSSPIFLSPDNVDAGIGRIGTGPEGTIVVVWSSTDGRARQVTRLPDPLLARPVVKGSGNVQAGQKTTYRVRVRNVGFGRAAGIQIRARGKGVGRTVKAGSLAGRKAKAVKIPLKFSEKGKVRVTFTVSSGKAGKKTVKKVVRVR